MTKKRLIPLTLFLLSLFTYYHTHDHLFSLAPVTEETTGRKWLIPTPVLEALAGEFRGVLSSFLLLEAGALYGTELKRVKGGVFVAVNREPDFDTLLRILKHSISLDPYFKQTYLSAEGWFPWNGERYVHEANSLLRIAADARWWDWKPVQLLGFNTYYFLNENGRAGKIFFEASKRENAPPYLAILGAKLAQKGNETGAAITLMKNLLAEKEPSDPGYDDMEDRLHALEGVLIIEKSIKKYVNEVGERPQNIEVLFASGFLNHIPDNPYDLPYCINSKAEVFFDKPNCSDETN